MSEILRQKEKEISELEERLSKHVTKRIERIANWCAGIGAILLMTTYNYGVYYMSKINPPENIDDNFVYYYGATLLGLGAGFVLGHHLGREEIATYKLSREYPSKANDIYRWEKMTQTPF